MKPSSWPVLGDRRTARSLLVRALVLWALLRVTLAAFGGWVLAPVALILFAAAAGALLVIDLKGVHEATFLANLGVGARHTFALGVGVALVAEVPFSHLVMLVMSAW